MSKDLTVVPHDYIVHFTKRDDLWAAQLADGSHICVVENEYIPLIRCKECKYRDPEDRKCDCGMWHFPYITKDNDFCSYGEREGE